MEKTLVEPTMIDTNDPNVNVLDLITSDLEELVGTTSNDDLEDALNLACDLARDNGETTLVLKIKNEG